MREMPSQAKVYRERRAALAKALRSKRVREHFYWGMWFRMDRRILNKKGMTSMEKVKDAVARLLGKKKSFKDCGTTACVAGWCPILFPDHWVQSDSGYPSLKPEYEGQRTMDAINSFAKFFGVPFDKAAAICGTIGWEWAFRNRPRPFGKRTPQMIADALEAING